MTKLVSYKHQDRQGFGLVVDDGIVELSGRTMADSLRGLIARELDLRRIGERFGNASADLALGEVDLLPPVLTPGKIICVGLNYHGHMTETGRAPVDYPTLFSRWADSHVGHNASIILPAASSRFDFEGELAVIIGKPGHHVAKSDAMSHVAGYSCYNDGSIRDWQRHTTQFLSGKNFIASGSFGPWLVAAGDVPDYRELELITRVNGAVVQQATLNQLIFDIPTLIAYITTFTRLQPGDVIVTGTPDGVGAFRDPPVWMTAGDRVEVEISAIGCLSNVVAVEATGVEGEGRPWVLSQDCEHP